MEDIFITLERNGTSWGRKLNVPTEYSIAGVEHDKNARCFRFKLPKLPEFQDLVDLSGLSCRVNYQHEFFDYAFTTDLFLETNETITDESGEEYLIFRIGGRMFSYIWKTFIHTLLFVQGRAG